MASTTMMTRDSGHVNTCPESPFSFQQEDEGLSLPPPPLSLPPSIPSKRIYASRGLFVLHLGTHPCVSNVFFFYFIVLLHLEARLRVSRGFFFLSFSFFLFYKDSKRIYASRGFFLFLLFPHSALTVEIGSCPLDTKRQHAFGIQPGTRVIWIALKL